MVYVYGVRHLCKMTNMAKHIMKLKRINPNFSKLLFLIPIQAVHKLKDQDGKKLGWKQQNLSFTSRRFITDSIKKELFYKYKIQKEDFYIKQLKKGLTPPEPCYSSITEYKLFDPSISNEIIYLKWIILSNAIVPLFQEIILVNYSLGYPYDQMVFSVYS